MAVVNGCVVLNFDVCRVDFEEICVSNVLQGLKARDFLVDRCKLLFTPDMDILLIVILDYCMHVVFFT